METQKVFMKSDKESLLSMSQAVMRLSEAHRIAGRADDEPAGGAPPGAATQDEEDVRMAAEPVGAPLVDAEDELQLEVVGVPQVAFQWT